MKSFLISHDYTSQPPKLRSRNNYSQHELTWTTFPRLQSTMKQHWDSYNIPLYITKSNINLHINKQKAFAIFHLNQLLKHKLSHLLLQLCDKQHDIVKFYCHQIYDKEVLPISSEDLPTILHQYPFLQLFHPNINPETKIQIKTRSLTISCLNTDGGAKNKLTNDHPYIYNIIKTHDPHIMAFLDTRLQSSPNFNIPGYTLIAISYGGDDTAHHIGGILVYKRIDVINKISIIHINHNTDTVILAYDNDGITHYITFCYCRPYKKRNKTKINSFYSNLNFQTSKLFNQSANCSHLIMGDFNARLGIITGDHNAAFNPNAKKLR